MKIVKTTIVFLSIAGLYSCQASTIEPATQQEMPFVKTKIEITAAKRTHDEIKFLKNSRLQKKTIFD